MSRELLAAACLAAAFIGCAGTGAYAGESETPVPDWFGPSDGNLLAGLGLDAALRAGPWTFRPVADLLPTTTGSFDRPVDTVTARLGFHGAAKVDSRVGAIYSRLSLSFEHEYRANQHQVITGPSAARRTGFYGDRSEVDMMTADAVFAMRMSGSTFGYVEYGAEMEPGGAADHQVILRFRFDF